MKHTCCLVLCSFVLALTCSTLAPAEEAPKPGPEHEKLGYWVGRWTNEAAMKENPIMPAGKMTSTDRCEWFDGKFAVVCHSEGTGPMGATKGLGIMGYSTEEKAYTYYGVDNTGMAMTTVARGRVDGRTWSFEDESMMDGKMVKSRYAMVTSDDTYTFKWEMQGENGEWITLMEGRGKRE